MAICEVCWGEAQRIHMEEETARTVTDIYNGLIDEYVAKGGHFLSDKQTQMHRRHETTPAVTTPEETETQ